MTTLLPGRPYPLGATWDGKGVNFALFSADATGVELCLFDSAEAPYEHERLALPERTDQIWHGYLPGAAPGLVYGYRVHGPFAPKLGLRFAPHKLLLDPYARAICNNNRWNETLYAYPRGTSNLDLSLDARDSAPYAPRAVVIDPAFDWGNDQPPAIPTHRSLIYELHVKGFTQQHPEVPEALRGSYAGLASAPVIDYLRALGVTAVELLPVHQHFTEPFLAERGRVNFWGYSTLGFFAPDARYSSSGDTGGQVREFKQMVKALHAAGIEVILDVVYNHTAEGNHEGPTLAFKGIDNRAYYRLVEDTPRYYMDYTGTGNTFDTRHPRALQLVMDSLRYWVSEMRVDGFRFDLTSALVRGRHDYDPHAPFFAAIQQDPVLSRVKLTAEPWDAAAGGYQVGNFPAPWAEWNGRFRDTVRRFWRGDDISVSEIANRLLGSPDMYQPTGRRPYASMNFITAHDGFTLRDLVSYEQKHNLANGEDNRDGENYNNSWNCGTEGPTSDRQITALRARQQRNLIATLLLAQGVPMLLAGDERNRSQGGNNNAYCQDNPTGWVSWKLDASGRELLSFTRRVVELRNRHPALQRRRFFQHPFWHSMQEPDATIVRPDGQPVSEAEWAAGATRCIGLRLDGRQMREWDAQGKPLHDATLLLLLNAHHQNIDFRLPAGAGAWRVLLDTAAPNGTETRQFGAGGIFPLRAHSLVLMAL